MVVGVMRQQPVPHRLIPLFVRPVVGESLEKIQLWSLEQLLLHMWFKILGHRGQPRSIGKRRSRTVAVRWL